jgi:hypothetical protein
MASKRRLRRRQCLGKRSYLNEQAANVIAKDMMGQGRCYVHSYHCSACGSWHVGHPPKGFSKSRADFKWTGAEIRGRLI